MTDIDTSATTGAYNADSNDLHQWVVSAITIPTDTSAVSGNAKHGQRRFNLQQHHHHHDNKEARATAAVCLSLLTPITAKKTTKSQKKSLRHLKWFTNAPHLVGALPGLFVVEGPLDGTDATQFTPKLMPVLQGSEGDKVVRDTWADMRSFRKFWRNLYYQHYFDSVEARAIHLMTSYNRDAADHIDMATARRALYLVDKTSDLLHLRGSNSSSVSGSKGKAKGKKTATKKRKRKDSSSNGEEAGDSEMQVDESTNENGEVDDETDDEATSDSYLRSCMSTGDYADYVDINTILREQAVACWKMPAGDFLETAFAAYRDVFKKALDVVSKRIYKEEEKATALAPLTANKVPFEILKSWMEMIKFTDPIGQVIVDVKDVPPFPAMFYYTKTTSVLCHRWITSAPCWMLEFARLCYNNNAAIFNYIGAGIGNGSNSGSIMGNDGDMDIATARRVSQGIPAPEFAGYLSTYESFCPSMLPMVLRFVLEPDNLHVPLQSLLEPGAYTAPTGVQSHSIEKHQATRTDRDHWDSISSFLRVLKSRSPRATETDTKWTVFIQTFGTYNKHYRSSMEASLNSFKGRMTPKGTSISPHFYLPPRSAVRLSDAVLTELDPRDSVYFAKSNYRGYFVCNTHQEEKERIERVNESDDEEEDGGNGTGTKAVQRNSLRRVQQYAKVKMPHLDNAEKLREEMTVWACRVPHFNGWIEVCKFLSDRKARTIGDWKDYMNCRSCVDQSILMSGYCQQVMKDYADKGGVILCFPLSIIYQRAFNDGIVTESNWLNAWDRFMSVPGFMGASVTTLEGGLMNQTQPTICIPHAEAMTRHEWQKLQQIVERYAEDANNSRPNIPIYVAFCPTLGGFSPITNPDGNSASMLLSPAIMIPQPVIKGLARSYVNQYLTRIGNSRTSPLNRSRSNAALTDDGSRSNNGLAFGDDSQDSAVHHPVRILLRFCEQLLQINDDAGDNSNGDKPRQVVIVDVNKFANEVLRRKSMPIEANTYINNFTREPRFTIDCEVGSRSSTSAGTDSYSTTMKLPAALCIQHNYIPFYRLIEFLERSGTSNTEEMLLKLGTTTVFPLRLANLLSRYPRGAFHVTKQDWDFYNSHWSQTSQAGALSFGSISVPIEAFCEIKQSENGSTEKRAVATTTTTTRKATAKLSNAPSVSRPILKLKVKKGDNSDMRRSDSDLENGSSQASNDPYVPSSFPAVATPAAGTDFLSSPPSNTDENGDVMMNEDGDEKSAESSASSDSEEDDRAEDTEVAEPVFSIKPKPASRYLAAQNANAYPSYENENANDAHDTQLLNETQADADMFDD